MADGRATDLTRARAVAPTILELADAGAKVLLLAHCGRPKGERHSTLSTSYLQGAVEDVLGRKLMYISEVAGPIVEQKKADALLCVRAALSPPKIEALRPERIVTLALRPLAEECGIDLEARRKEAHTQALREEKRT